MWIKTITGDLHAPDSFDAFYQEGTFLTKSQYNEWAIKDAQALLSKSADWFAGRKVDIPVAEQLWAVFGNKKGDQQRYDKDVLIGYGTKEVAAKLQNAIAGFLSDRSDFFDAGEYLTSINSAPQ